MPKPALEDYGRLCVAIQRSRKALQAVREERVAAVREYVGAHYSENGSTVPVPYNLVAQFVQTVGRRLVANNPRMMLSTKLKSGKPVAKIEEAWVNEEIERQNHQETLERAVIDGLFDFGIVKVALATPSDAALKGWNLKAGDPLMSVIDLDDFVMDTNAKRFDECDFVGHRYRVPLATIKNSKLYSSARMDLTADYHRKYNAGGDERISQIGATDYASWYDDYEDMVDLWEIYLPRHRLVCTFHNDGLGEPEVSTSGVEQEPLRVQRWLGPECGPYHLLGFGTVPGNLRPKAPVHDLVDLHRSVNGIVRKLIRESARLKILDVVDKNNPDDAKAVKEASDGDLVQLKNVMAVTKLVLGGADQGLQAIGTHFMNLFDKMGGNLSLLAGTAPQSPTARQDMMLNQNASSSITDMQQTVTKYVGQVEKAMCWFHHHNPFKTMKTTYHPPGLPDMQIDRQATPQQRRQIPWEQLALKVDPYSLTFQTPEQKSANLKALVTQIIIPALPIIEKSGAAFDVQKFLQLISEWDNLQEITEIVTIQEPPTPDPNSAGDSESAGMPANTTRTYERHSSSAGTDGAENNQIQTMMKQATDARSA